MSEDATSVMYATPCPVCGSVAMRLREGRTVRCGKCGLQTDVTLRIKLDGPEFTMVRDPIDHY